MKTRVNAEPRRNHVDVAGLRRRVRDHGCDGPGGRFVRIDQ